MNSKKYRLIGRLTGLLLLLPALAVPYAALAQGMEVNSADPAMTIEGTVNLDVAISGKGFDNTIDVVRFLLPCEVEPCTDTGGIRVNHWKVRGSKKIIANIDVADPASLPSEYEGHDIEVMSSSRGRGGKGTTLFTVEKKSNRTIVSCDRFAPNGTCDCEFDWENDIYTLQDDCRTSETLWLGHSKMWGNHQTDWSTLTVVNCSSLDDEIPDCEDKHGSSFEGQFLGSSVIANTNHRAAVRHLNIRFDDAVLRGCDPYGDDDRIQSAVHFRLHGGISEEPAVFSFLRIDNVSIESHFDPLCNAIEVVREPDYTQRWPESRDSKVRVEVVEITDASYVISGIRYEGIKPNGSVNPPIVFGNTIGAPACDGDDPSLDPGTARAIHFGRVLLPDSSDPSSRIAGRVESNTIRMATSCGTLGGVGILVLGEPGDPSGDQTTAEVVKNDISGALTGVLVDDHVVDINFSGNTLIGVGGDDPGIYDVGIDSSAQCTRKKGKPNKITGFDMDFIDADCP